MKKLMSMLAIALVIASCGNDDDDITDQINAPIVGTFVLTSSNSPFNDDYNGDGTTSENLLDEVPCLSNTITFNADGSYTITATNLVVEIDGNGNTSADCEGPYVETGTYTYIATNLELTEISTTDPDGESDIELNNNVTIVTTEGMTITVATGFGNSVFVFERQ